MMRDCPHGKDEYLFLSGTQVRQMLSEGTPLPPEFARPQVAQILMDHYRSVDA
jgi:sulfate adenylyltransferase